MTGIPTPTRAQWAAYSPHVRALLRARLTPEQLATLTPRVAVTPDWDLRYPSDYNDPADSPNAFQQLATDTDTALTKVIERVLPHRTLTRPEAVSLTANSTYAIAWSHDVSQPAGTVPAMSGLGNDVLTTLFGGLFLFELVCFVEHGTVGRKNDFELKLDQLSGSSTGQYALPLRAEQVTSGGSNSLILNHVAYAAKGDTYRCSIQPVGSGATGWVMTYTHHTITQIR